eukprot:scaffold6996_cov112-Isochrysis_galbana.AAC.7
MEARVSFQVGWETCEAHSQGEPALVPLLRHPVSCRSVPLNRFPLFLTTAACYSTCHPTLSDHTSAATRSVTAFVGVVGGGWHGTAAARPCNTAAAERRV